MLIEFPPGPRQPAALVQAIQIEEPVLQADAPVVDAPVQAEASLQRKYA